MKTRPKLPLEARADVLEEVTRLLKTRCPYPDAAIEYLMGMFTTVDLIQIRANLKERK
jgi:hypothetical protein